MRRRRPLPQDRSGGGGGGSEKSGGCAGGGDQRGVLSQRRVPVFNRNVRSSIRWISSTISRTVNNAIIQRADFCFDVDNG